MRHTISSGSIFARPLAICAAIAAFTLLAPTASAQFQVHPPRGGANLGGNPENPNSDAFGAAVAIRSGLAFISAPFHPRGGAVVVYTATPTALMPTGIELRPSNAEPFETFGLKLTYRDGVLLVASDLALYVFQRNGSGVWTQRQKFPFSPGAMRYEDGTLAIGASGAVNIYQRDAAGKFTLRQKLVSPDSAPNDGLGDIGMAGPTMVVGGKGRAYVFRRTSTGVWRHRQTLFASELGTEQAARAGFGGTVAIDRGMIIVAAAGLNRIQCAAEGRCLLAWQPPFHGSCRPAPSGGHSVYRFFIHLSGPREIVPPERVPGSVTPFT